MHIRAEDMRRILPLLFVTALWVSAQAEDEPSQEARFLNQPRQLIFEGKRSGEGYFRPDGKQLIFQSEREAGNPFYQIYLLDFETGETARVSPGAGKTTCAFFQPGTDRVLFASTHDDPEAAAKQKAELEFRASGKQRRYSWDYDEAIDIYSANQDGTDLEKSHALARLRRGGFVFAGREADRLLLAARGVSARTAFARSSGSVTRRTQRSSATSTS